MLSSASLARQGCSTEMLLCVSSAQGLCCREPDLLNKPFLAAVLCKQPGNGSAKNWEGLAREEPHWRNVHFTAQHCLSGMGHSEAGVTLSLCLLRAPDLLKLHGEVMLHFYEFAEHRGAVLDTSELHVRLSGSPGV